MAWNKLPIQTGQLIAYLKCSNVQLFISYCYINVNVTGHFACNDDNWGWVNANKLSIERAQRINIEHDTIIIAVNKINNRWQCEKWCWEMLLPNSSFFVCAHHAQCTMLFSVQCSVFSIITAWIIITNHQLSVFHLKHWIYQQKCRFNFVGDPH